MIALSHAMLARRRSGTDAAFRNPSQRPPLYGLIAGGNAMPRYFFHVVGNNGFFDRDREGLELENLAAARREACAFVRELRADAAREGAEFQESVEAVDEWGTVLFCCAGAEKISA
jgi:hypothetical protein